MDKISSFSGKYSFLSNFHPHEIVFEGVKYPTVEHAYQAAKTLDPAERQKFLGLTAGQAKRLGRKVALRPDWETVKLEIMYELLEQKFRRSSICVELLATRSAYLEEGNTWGDVFWGVCEGVGENRLGKMLMEVRAFYQKQYTFTLINPKEGV